MVQSYFTEATPGLSEDGCPASVAALLPKRPGFSSMLLYTKLKEAHLKCSPSFIQKYILDHNFKLLQKVRTELSTLDIMGRQKITILLPQKSY